MLSNRLYFLDFDYAVSQNSNNCLCGISNFLMPHIAPTAAQLILAASQLFEKGKLHNKRDYKRVAKYETKLARLSLAARQRYNSRFTRGMGGGVWWRWRWNV